eukprot:g7903.t1
MIMKKQERRSRWTVSLLPLVLHLGSSTTVAAHAQVVADELFPKGFLAQRKNPDGSVQKPRPASLFQCASNPWECFFGAPAGAGEEGGQMAAHSSGRPPLALQPAPASEVSQEGADTFLEQREKKNDHQQHEAEAAGPHPSQKEKLELRQTGVSGRGASGTSTLGGSTTSGAVPVSSVFFEPELEEQDQDRDRFLEEKVAPSLSRGHGFAFVEKNATTSTSSSEQGEAAAPLLREGGAGAGAGAESTEPGEGEHPGHGPSESVATTGDAVLRFDPKWLVSQQLGPLQEDVSGGGQLQEERAFLQEEEGLDLDGNKSSKLGTRDEKFSSAHLLMFDKNSNSKMKILPYAPYPSAIERRQGQYEEALLDYKRRKLGCGDGSPSDVGERPHSVLCLQCPGPGDGDLAGLASWSCGKHADLPSDQNGFCHFAKTKQATRAYPYVDLFHDHLWSLSSPAGEYHTPVDQGQSRAVRSERYVKEIGEDGKEKSGLVVIEQYMAPKKAGDDGEKLYDVMRQSGVLSYVPAPGVVAGDTRLSGEVVHANGRPTEAGGLSSPSDSEVSATHLGIGTGLGLVFAAKPSMYGANGCDRGEIAASHLLGIALDLVVPAGQDTALQENPDLLTSLGKGERAKDILEKWRAVETEKVKQGSDKPPYNEKLWLRIPADFATPQEWEDTSNQVRFSGKAASWQAYVVDKSSLVLRAEASPAKTSLMNGMQNELSKMRAQGPLTYKRFFPDAGAGPIQPLHWLDKYIADGSYRQKSTIHTNLKGQPVIIAHGSEMIVHNSETHGYGIGTMYKCTDFNPSAGSFGTVCKSMTESGCGRRGEAPGSPSDAWSCNYAEGTEVTTQVIKAIRCKSGVDTKCRDDVAREALINLLLTEAPGTKGHDVANCVTKLHKVVILRQEPSQQHQDFLLVIEKVFPGDNVVAEQNWRTKVTKNILEIHHQTMECWKNLAHFGFVHNDIKPANVGFLESSATAAPRLKQFDFGLSVIVDVADKNPEGGAPKTTPIAYTIIFGPSDSGIRAQRQQVPWSPNGQEWITVEAQWQQIASGSLPYMPPSDFSCSTNSVADMSAKLRQPGAWSQSWQAAQFGPKTDLFAIALTLGALKMKCRGP